MRVVVITPPSPLISLAQAKAYLRVDGNDEDVLITGMVAAATAHIDGPDGYLGRAIGLQTLEARGNLFTAACLRLPFPPIMSVVSVKYDDDAGVEQLLTSSSYDVQGDRLLAASGLSWPNARTSTEPVRIQYQAGYSVLPPAICAAILLMVGDLWSFRSTAVTGLASSPIAMTTTVENLLARFRVWA